MATKTKSTRANARAAESLQQEKEETVEVKQLLKDERTHKIAGSICILLAILFFIAFTSYLFTWDEDQDKVFKDGYRLLLGTDTHVANLMGTFGAFIAHFFMYKGFGVAAYLLCSFFFVIGVNLFFGKKIFSITRNIKYLVIGLPLISITASMIMQGQAFPWGGAVGDMSRDYLYTAIGKIGTIGLIGVSFLAYVIWRFNPTFKLPEKKERTAVDAQDNLETALVADEDEGPQEATLTIQGNALRGGAGMLNVP